MSGIKSEHIPMHNLLRGVIKAAKNHKSLKKFRNGQTEGRTDRRTFSEYFQKNRMILFFTFLLFLALGALSTHAP